VASSISCGGEDSSAGGIGGESSSGSSLQQQQAAAAPPSPRPPGGGAQQQPVDCSSSPDGVMLVQNRVSTPAPAATPAAPPAGTAVTPYLQRLQEILERGRRCHQEQQATPGGGSGDGGNVAKQLGAGGRPPGSLDALVELADGAPGSSSSSSDNNASSSSAAAAAAATPLPSPGPKLPPPSTAGMAQIQAILDQHAAARRSGASALYSSQMRHASVHAKVAYGSGSGGYASGSGGGGGGSGQPNKQAALMRQAKAAVRAALPTIREQAPVLLSVVAFPGGQARARGGGGLQVAAAQAFFLGGGVRWAPREPAIRRSRRSWAPP
jgi:hypothetical protein